MNRTLAYFAGGVALSALLYTVFFYAPVRDFFVSSIANFKVGNNQLAQVPSAMPESVLDQVEELETKMRAIHEKINALSDPKSVELRVSSINENSSFWFSSLPNQLVEHIGTVLITNPGASPIVYKEVVGMSNPFSFKGGEFPGNGGTCGKILTNGCTLVFSFNAPLKALPKTNIVFDYIKSIYLSYGVGDVAKTSSEFKFYGSIIPEPVIEISVNGSKDNDNVLNLPPLRLGREDSAAIEVKITKHFLDKTNYGLNISTPNLKPPFFTFGNTPCDKTIQGYYCKLNIRHVPAKAGVDGSDVEINYDTISGRKKVVRRLSRTVLPGFDSSLTPSKNLLIVYNAKSKAGTLLKDYYMNNRPGFGEANVLGISYPSRNCETNCPDPDSEIMYDANMKSDVADPIKNWMNNNREKEIKYIVVLAGIPARTATYSGVPNYSVDYGLNLYFRTQGIYVNRLDMGSLEATKAYIDKLKDMYENMPAKGLFISSQGTGNAGSTYYIEDIRADGYPAEGVYAKNILQLQGSDVDYRAKEKMKYITSAKNVAGFFSWGIHAGRSWDYTYRIPMSGNSGWYIIQTLESFNGNRDGGISKGEHQGKWIDWFSENAFGGSNYENTPVGAVAHAEEPGGGGWNSSEKYFGCWNKGGLFADCAWESRRTPFALAIGDPWVRK